MTSRVSPFIKASTRAYDLLDLTNARILDAMDRVGPRNVTKIAKHCKVPVTTVLARLRGLESTGLAVCTAVPYCAKLGLRRVIVFVKRRQCDPRDFLKIPNYWRSVTECEGGGWSSLSIHAIPNSKVDLFEGYLKELKSIDVISDYTAYYLGESHWFFPSLRFFNTKQTRWEFPWLTWLEGLRTTRPLYSIDDPSSYRVLADKKDLEMLSLLELNGRSSFTDIAKEIGYTPAGVQQRYNERILRLGLLLQYSIHVWMWPVQTTAVRDVLLNFSSKGFCDCFYTFVRQNHPPFVWGLSKLLGRTSLIMRVTLPYEESDSLFDYLNRLSRDGFIESYSAVRLLMQNRETQTIPPEEFSEGFWKFDQAKYREAAITLHDNNLKSQSIVRVGSVKSSSA
jgi:DNA-binding Lrp family transcriptional regulator